MAQKRSKQEIGERLLLLKEKQEVLTEQLNTLLQELGTSIAVCPQRA